MEKCRLLILDIDGTLLNSRGEITPKTLSALAELKQKGIPITLATGRMFIDTLPIARRLGISYPLILHHGAVIREPAGPVVEQKLLSIIALTKLVDIARSSGISFQAYVADDLVVEKITEWTETYLKYSYARPRVVKDLLVSLEQPPCQFDILGTPKELEIVKNTIQQRLGETVCITSSHPNLLEVTGPGVSKGNAVNRLVSHLKIPMKHVIAIGDGLNDLEMIRAVGIGVAMGNAPNALKNAASYITLSNDRDGVAHFIYKLLNRETF